MKKFRIITLLMIIAVALFGGIIKTYAATSLPNAVVSDVDAKPNLEGGLREVEYIKNFPVIVKSADHGKYNIYCMNLSATYASNITFTKTGAVDPGYTYILKNRPQTSNKDRDFYITQMAVWYYEDYLNNDNFNLVPEVKYYIIRHKDTEDISKQIYALFDGAKNYKEVIGKLSIEKNPITFKEENGYFVSSEIKIHKENLKGDVKYSLSNAPKGSLVVKSTNGVKVKVPVEKIDIGKQVTLSLNVEGSYTKYTGYYYYHSSKYQKVLFQDALETTPAVKDSISMTVARRKENFEVQISKTDITQSKEIEGATLVVKDEAGKVIESWVSTTTSHKITLKPGKYSLTETIAPKGYKLSKTTIEFMLDANGGLYVKNEKGVYEAVNRVVMINELIDVVSFAKRDSKTNELVSGAKLVIKDSKNNVVKEFTSENTYYQLQLDPGYYSLSEVKAPNGYLLSKEIIYFQLMEDGTLKVKNEKGEYTDSAVITFYNTKEKKEIVKVPATDKNATLMIIGGIALLIGGVACARKTIKEC